MLRIRLLGAVSAWAGSEDLALGGPRPRALLALLALAAPRALSSAHIVDGLWGEDPPATARNAVQVNVTGLRKGLRPHGVDIERVGDGYALRGPAQVDAAQFEQLVSAGRTALRAGDVGYSQVSLREALALWEGAPFDGLGDPPFGVEARQALERVRDSALVDLADAYLRAGDPAAATLVAQELLHQHPYDEPGWVALATAQYFSGRQDQALATCRRAREVLLDELGVDPTAALVEVERQILRHELPDRSAANEAASSDSADDPGPTLPALPFLVGREKILDDVAELFSEGRRLVSLVGIGGIGKTTLALAAAHRLEALAVCSLETETEAASALARLCRTLGIDPEDDPSEALAALAPTGIVVLDNLEQVADIGRALDRLLSRIAGLAVLVTSRRPTGSRLERSVTVPPLGQDSAEIMFREHAERVRPGISGTDADSVTRLCALLDGIPLAIEIAAGRIRTLTPHQLLARIERRRTSVLDASRGGAMPERQASLHGVLQEAFEALTDPARRLFELFGSVEGSISLELLEGAAEDLVDDVVEALDELAGCGLVSLDLAGCVAMRGPVREYARSAGPRESLDGRLQRQVLSLVVDNGPRLFGPEAGAALATLQRDEDSLNAAIAGAIDAAEPGTSAQLVLGMNRYWLLSGRLSDGRSWIERAVGLSGHDPADDVRLALLAGTYASYFDDVATPSMLGDALSRAEIVGLPVDRLLVNGWCCLAAHAAHHGDFDTADNSSRRAAALAAQSGNPALVALARDIDGHVASYVKDYDRALTAKLAGLADARAAGDLFDIISLLVVIANDLLDLGRLEEALAYSDEAFDLTSTFDPGPLLGQVLLQRGIVLAVAERVPAARGNLLQAIRLSQERRPDSISTADGLFAFGACLAHDLEDAEACRYFGAADALFSGHGVDADERLAPALVRARDSLCDRLGREQFATLTALGSTDPARTLKVLLG